MNRPSFRPDQFRKSTRSPNNPVDKDCVHVARGMGWVLVRDTKEVFDGPTDHKLAFTDEQFDAFLGAIQLAGLTSAVIPAGVLEGTCVAIDRVAEDINVFRSLVEQPGLPAGAALTFTDGELVAFFAGVHLGEFAADGEFTEHDADCAHDCAKAGHVALAAV